MFAILLPAYSRFLGGILAAKTSVCTRNENEPNLEKSFYGVHTSNQGRISPNVVNP